MRRSIVLAEAVVLCDGEVFGICGGIIAGDALGGVMRRRFKGGGLTDADRDDIACFVKAGKLIQNLERAESMTQCNDD